MKRIAIILTIALSISCGLRAAESVKLEPDVHPLDLRGESLVNPLGIDF